MVPSAFVSLVGNSWFGSDFALLRFCFRSAFFLISAFALLYAHVLIICQACNCEMVLQSGVCWTDWTVHAFWSNPCRCVIVEDLWFLSTLDDSAASKFFRKKCRQWQSAMRKQKPDAMLGGWGEDLGSLVPLVVLVGWEREKERLRDFGILWIHSLSLSLSFISPLITPPLLIAFHYVARPPLIISALSLQHWSFISSLLGPNFQSFSLLIQGGAIPGLMDIVTSESSSEGAKEEAEDICEEIFTQTWFQVATWSLYISRCIHFFWHGKAWLKNCDDLSSILAASKIL